ncbi:MAG: DNA replication/repair protein RecF [Dehalococcoidia bacterium]|nr:DNA replication/repair protein RecF [Dehalococcoidia bacterium]
MHIQHLSLTNFRNYVRLELDLPPDISVFHGANAQGKTTLLESVCFLATTRFSRPVAEREIINWNATNEKMPFARLSANVQRNSRTIKLDIVLQPRAAVKNEQGLLIAPMQKRIRVNGVAQRAADLMGQLNMVMFSPRDIDLIDGEPSLRRRYLDMTNSQVDPHYLRALQRYSKVLARRNHLLRQIAAHQARPDELAFWNQEMISTGSYIIYQRERAISELNDLANPINEQLSGGREKLKMKYRRSIDASTTEFASLGDVDQAFRKAITEAYPKELARGISLVGPHRDDMEFQVNEVDMGPYGSRGQQRTIALALKLAEVKFMLAQTGETPVLLLDDVLSELDSERRRHLLESVGSYQQVLITTTDLDRFPPDFLAGANQFIVENGQIRNR